MIGGTKEANDWETEPRPETRAEILEAVAKMYPPILGESGQLKIIRDIVGRRPARRGGFRLETETPKASSLRDKKIVHAYGANGSGYALSWGMARQVVEMVIDAGHFTKASL